MLGKEPVGLQPVENVQLMKSSLGKSELWAKPLRGKYNMYRGLLIFGVISGLLVGCVSSEKYEAEKARALNFQRLLAQEEKRTGELNVQVQEARRQASGLESQNKDLSTELQGLRDQLNRAQEDLAGSSGSGDMMAGNEDLTLSEPSLAEFGLSDIGFGDSDFADLGGTDTAMGGEATHMVEKGDTLYRISKQYGVSVDDLKFWNNLGGNLISVGQKLIVSSP